MAKPGVEEQADYMADVLSDLRSFFVTAGNKLQPKINRLKERGLTEADLVEVADEVRYLLEDELEFALQEVREMDREAEELATGEDDLLEEDL